MSALLKRLSQTTPPVMPETVDRLQALHARQEVTRHPDIGRVLMDDPAATVAVFRELERTRPGAFERVSDTAHAVSLLGVARFQSLVGALPQVSSEVEGGHNPGIGTALAQGAHAARFATALASHAGLAGDTEVATAALLQNPAWLALWASAPDLAAQVATAVQRGQTLQAALQHVVGEPVAELNDKLARAWAMPTLARQAITPVRGDTRPKLGAVRLADEVATATSAGWHHPMVNALPEKLAEFLALEPDDASRWLHEQATDIARELSDYAYPLAGYDLLLLPPGEQETKPTPVAAADAVAKPSTEKGPEQRAASAKAPPKANKAGQPKGPNLHDTMVDIMRRIRSETGARRVLFAMLSSDRRQLRTRMVLGGQRDDTLRRLDLDAEGRHLFGALMKKSQSVWLNSGNVSRYEPLLTDALRGMIRPDNAYLMSLFVRGRALGLLYVDGDELTDTGYRRFRSLCNSATDALAS